MYFLTHRITVAVVPLPTLHYILYLFIGQEHRSQVEKAFPHGVDIGYTLVLHFTVRIVVWSGNQNRHEEDMN